MTILTLPVNAQECILSKEKFDFFKNLIMEGNQTRKNGKYDFIKWQVDTPNKDQTLENVLPNLMTALDDGILELSHKSVEYTVQGIQVRSPFNSTGETVKIEERSNSDNATPSTSINTPTISANDQIQSGKAIIDSETGTVLKGEVADKSNTKLETAKDIANKIVEDSKVMKQDENGSDYTNTKTGKRFTRITSISQAFDQENPWILPSTNIEAGIVDFIKDFFAGEFFENGKLINDFFYDYPNATNGQWKKLASQFQTLKNSFDAKGINIIPKDFIITRTLNLSNSNGEENTVDVAEASVLLGYDQQGNFHIYGIKTFRDNLNQQENEEYTKLLYSYSEFLKNTYGINIRSLNMIPIKVEYPEPNSNNEYTINYANQLFLNDENFLKTNIELLPTTELNSKESNINKNNKPLTKEEQEILNKAPRNSKGKLLVRPGGPVSNLTERQYAQVRTKAFKNWFGDWEKGLTIQQDDKSYYRGQYEEPIIDKNGNLILKGRKDPLYEKAGYNIEKGVSATTDMISANEYGTNQKYAYEADIEDKYGELDQSWEKEQKLNEVAEHGYYLIQFPKNITNQIINEAGEVKIVGDIVIPKGQYIIEHITDKGTEVLAVSNNNASKVVDKNGEPLVVYHGTDENFNIFDYSFFGSSMSWDLGKGFYLTSDYKTAQEYAGLIGNVGFIPNKNGRVLSLFVNLRNPGNTKEHYDDTFKGGKNTGIDGMYFGTFSEFTVLNPNQIKSATDNSGIFSTTNDDIYDTIEASVNQNSSEVTAPTEIKEVKDKEDTITNNNKIVMDPNAGLNAAKTRDRRKQNKNNENSNNKVNPRPTRLIPSRLTWGVWEGFTNKEGKPIDVQQSIKELSKFYTKEEWNQLSDEIMEKELICKGIYYY